MHISVPISVRRGLQSRLGRLLACAALVMCVIELSAPLLRAEDAAAPAPGTPAPTVIRKSLWNRVEQGGIVMIPIGLCSIATVWLIVDGWMRTTGKRMAPPAHVAGARDLFRLGDYVGAYQFCKNNLSPFCNVTRVALSYAGDGQTATEEAMLGEVQKANAQIQTRINYLSVIGVCAPMIGLVGTVIGMMGAFEVMGEGAATQDPGRLAEKIGEVLVATASGLFIAIPAFMFFYFLRNRLQGAVHHLEEEVVALFRKMPYEHLKDTHVGEEEFYAATPNWVGPEEVAQAVAS